MGCCQSSQQENLLIKKSEYVMNKKGNIQDSYEILQSLGRGSFGSVSRVRDRKTGLEKAMKEVIKLQVPSQQLSLILNEIEILKGLDHPNIMKLFEIIESPKCYYIICEYLQGGDLFNLLKRKKTFTEEKSKKLMFDLLSGLNYLHSNKIVHLDLKLENLVLTNETPDSKLKIVDFGVSRRMTSSPFSGKIGSVISNQANYLAPEVLSGDFNEKVDIWCAGVILYMMISGSFPFKYDTDEKYLARIQNEVLSFDKKAWSKVSDSCIDLLRKMLNPNKDKRISALRALKHPWLKTEADNSLMSIQTSYCDNLRSFKRTNKIVSSILVYIASQMLTHQEESPIAKMFRALDSDGNGKLSKQELVETSTSLKLFTPEEAEEIFEKCDMDRSGFIDYNEFLVATMSWNQLLSDQKAQMVFKYFEKCGKLSLDELKSCFTNVSEKEWREFLLQVDEDKNGDISLQEFKEYLINTIRS